MTGISLQAELSQAAAGEEPATDSSLRDRIIDAALAAPLQVKLAGAGLVLVAAAIAAVLAAGNGVAGSSRYLMIAVFAIAVSVIVNLLLVRAALRPLHDLEVTAERIWNGDVTARVPASRVADRELTRLGRALNLVLDSLMRDRARIRRLASEVIRIGDHERSRLGRALHEDAAQSVAALMYQLSALEADAPADLAAELGKLRASMLRSLEQLTELAQSTHPRVLDDLGLGAALRQLVRNAADQSGVDVSASCHVKRDDVPADTALVSYRIVQEALRNALAHGNPTRIGIAAWIDGDRLITEVSDNGQGFDTGPAATHEGTGLFMMSERTNLANGTLHLESTSDAGTLVRATIPLQVQSSI
jgi:signal transduction histidine kinase